MEKYELEARWDAPLALLMSEVRDVVDSVCLTCLKICQYTRFWDLVTVADTEGDEIRMLATKYREGLFSRAYTQRLGTP